MVELKQPRGFQTRKFKLYDDKVVVETKTLTKNRKYEVKLDQIGHELLYESDVTIFGKVAFYVCIGIPLILLIVKLSGQKIENSIIVFNFLLWYLLALLNYLKQHQDDLIIIGGQNSIAFFRTIPNEEEVTEFASLVILKSKNYIKARYSVTDPDIPEETFMNRITWLREREIITESESARLKNEYNYKKLL